MAKDIKQEIIDSTSHDMSQCHSETCAITRYLQEQDRSLGLCIEDVGTVLVAEKVTQKPVTQQWSHILHRPVEEASETDKTL